METPRFPTVSPLDADALRQAAREVRTAEDDLAALNAMVARPFLPTEQELRDAEQAFAQAKAARKELPPAWRRTLGAALCGTGMVILIGALSWDRYWFPVPVGLIAITTADLWVIRQAARRTSVRAARELGALGVSGPHGLAQLWSARGETDAAAGRLVDARLRQEEARAAWRRLAPDRQPSEVETIIAEWAAADRSGPQDRSDA